MARRTEVLSGVSQASAEWADCGLVLFEEGFAHFREGGILQLADPLARYAEFASDVFQEHRLESAEAEALVDDAAFAFIEERKKAAYLIVEIFVGEHFQWVRGGVVTDDVAVFRGLALVDGSV